MIKRIYRRFMLKDFEVSPDDHVTPLRFTLGCIVFGSMMLVLIIGKAAGF